MKRGKHRIYGPGNRSINLDGTVYGPGPNIPHIVIGPGPTLPRIVIGPGTLTVPRKTNLL